MADAWASLFVKLSEEALSRHLRGFRYTHQLEDGWGDAAAKLQLSILHDLNRCLKIYVVIDSVSLQSAHLTGTEYSIYGGHFSPGVRDYFGVQTLGILDSLCQGVNGIEPLQMKVIESSVSGY